MDLSLPLPPPMDGEKSAIMNDFGPKDAILAAPKKKEPPSETTNSIRTRGLVLVSYWAIVLLLGLPMWWKTTATYRASLPLDQMIDWADGRVCRPVFPLKISIDPGSLKEQEAQHLLRSTQHVLDDLNDFSAHHLRLQLARPSNTTVDPTLTNNEEVAMVIRLLPGRTNDAILQTYEPVLDIYYTSNQASTSLSSSSLATYIANKVRAIFAEEQAMIAYLLATSSEALAPDVVDSLAKATTRTVKYSGTYHLTFSLFTPSYTPSSWNIQAALEEYMKPLLKSFSSISNFTIDTQVQLYARPGVEGLVLKKEDLSRFINAAEWPLSPSIGLAPTIHFILYVGEMEVEGGGKSWLIPQWGGVVIQPNVDDLRPAMLTFSNQLLSLLGTPESGSLPLRLMTLIRVRSLALLLKASGTLGSLARLTLALPSIIIPPVVAEGVPITIEHLEKACSSLGGKQGLDNARIAEEAAEKSFFEESMVGQAYFPFEHKATIYVSFIAQIGVPLVGQTVRYIRKWRNRHVHK